MLCHTLLNDISDQLRRLGCRIIDVLADTLQDCIVKDRDSFLSLLDHHSFMVA